VRAIKRAFLWLISFPQLSRIYRRIVNIKRPQWLVKAMICLFQKHYRIDLNHYEKREYTSLADFFVRRLDKQERPLKSNCDYFLSPADGRVSVITDLLDDRVLQVKGKYYSLQELLQTSVNFAQKWKLFTIYLSPSDYHRFHAPVNMKIKRYCYISGRLYPVNDFSVNLVSALYQKNERVVVEFTFKQHLAYFVAVGATFVGNICFSFFDKKSINYDQWYYPDVKIAQLDELGRFEMGSTIILLMPSELITEVVVCEDDLIKVGMPLAKLKS